MPHIQADAFNTETFSCGRCMHDFQAAVTTWVDVSRFPYVKTLLHEGEFNKITCPRCGHRQFSGSFFFYEDFAEGLLAAVFPSIPDNHESLEEEIQQKYGFYPVLEIFYDMTQLWFLIYLQEHYRSNRNPAAFTKLGKQEDRLRRFLQFVKHDPLMLTIRDALSETLSGVRTHDDLQGVLWRALAKLEGVPGGQDRDLLPAWLCVV
jgi:hypothetical protein